jgi:hypothetical protein
MEEDDFHLRYHSGDTKEKRVGCVLMKVKMGSVIQYLLYGTEWHKKRIK